MMEAKEVQRFREQVVEIGRRVLGAAPAKRADAWEAVVPQRWMYGGGQAGRKLGLAYSFSVPC